MGLTRQINLGLPVDLADAMERKLSSGAYPDASTMVTASLEALLDTDAAEDNWLRTDVVSAYDAMLAHPERALSLETVREELRRRHREAQRSR